MNLSVFHFFLIILICSEAWSLIVPLSDVNSPAPFSPQKIHPPKPTFPSLLGQLNPPSIDILATFSPKTLLNSALRVLYFLPSKSITILILQCLQLHPSSFPLIPYNQDNTYQYL